MASFWGRWPLVASALRGAGGALIIYTGVDSLADICLFDGPSMEPTIHPDEIGIAEKVTPYNGFKRGDIVIATQPDDPSMRICKRIVALEGDEVKYSKRSFDPDRAEIMNRTCIPRGHIWLEGDNTSNSRDSRHYGPVPLALVHGRVFAKVYPFRSMTWFPRSPDVT